MIDNKLIDKIIQFRNDRNWTQYHTPKNLAISLSLEANELLELFQWVDSEDAVENNKSEIQDELADIFIYLILMVDRLNLDLEEIVESKLIKNKEKYPVNKSYGSNAKYNEL